jgi:6-carboxyhexanoate--CoA ligase
MRAARGCIHEEGGEHLSGCERMIAADAIRSIIDGMLQRIEKHPKGQADAINFRIDRIEEADIVRINALPIENRVAATVEEAEEVAIHCLKESCISPQAARIGVQLIRHLKSSMRGAMILDAESGVRLDETESRGVRLSHMDCEDEEKFLSFLRSHGLNGTKTREALILASKASAMDGYLGELCWSDDPGYVSGYVASTKSYCRITPLKNHANPIGGRILFVKKGLNIPKAIQFLEKKPTLVIA